MPKAAKTSPRPVYWGGRVESCDICGQPLASAKRIIDGRTNSGPWALMDVSCHKDHGLGLGTGSGQAYEKQADGRWLKVEG